MPKTSVSDVQKVYIFPGTHAPEPPTLLCTKILSHQNAKFACHYINKPIKNNMAVLTRCTIQCSKYFISLPLFDRLRVVPHFSSGIVERAKRERVKINPREKRRHAAGREKNEGLQTKPKLLTLHGRLISECEVRIPFQIN